MISPKKQKGQTQEQKRKNHVISERTIYLTPFLRSCFLLTSWNVSASQQLLFNWYYSVGLTVMIITFGKNTIDWTLKLSTQHVRLVQIRENFACNQSYINIVKLNSIKLHWVTIKRKRKDTNQSSNIGFSLIRNWVTGKKKRKINWRLYQLGLVNQLLNSLYSFKQQIKKISMSDFGKPEL